MTVENISDQSLRENVAGHGVGGGGGGVGRVCVGGRGAWGGGA